MNIIAIKRRYFSLDETNLEYHGLLAQIGVTSTVEIAIDDLQRSISSDYELYLDLVCQNVLVNAFYLSLL